jgi:hypothetical protein
LPLGQLDRAERAFTEAAMVSRGGRARARAPWSPPFQQVNVQRLRGVRRRALATGWATLAWQPSTTNFPAWAAYGRLWPTCLLDANDVAGALPLAVEGLRAPA